MLYLVQFSHLLNSSHLSHGMPLLRSRVGFEQSSKQILASFLVPGSRIPNYLDVRDPDESQETMPHCKWKRSDPSSYMKKLVHWFLWLLYNDANPLITSIWVYETHVTGRRIWLLLWMLQSTNAYVDMPFLVWCYQIKCQFVKYLLYL